MLDAPEFTEFRGFFNLALLAGDYRPIASEVTTFLHR